MILKDCLWSARLFTHSLFQLLTGIKSQQPAERWRRRMCTSDYKEGPSFLRLVRLFHQQELGHEGAQGKAQLEPKIQMPSVHLLFQAAVHHRVASEEGSQRSRSAARSCRWKARAHGRPERTPNRHRQQQVRLNKNKRTSLVQNKLTFLFYFYSDSSSAYKRKRVNLSDTYAMDEEHNRPSTSSKSLRDEVIVIFFCLDHRFIHPFF